jgi:hypothetical protein
MSEEEKSPAGQGEATKDASEKVKTESKPENPGAQEGNGGRGGLCESGTSFSPRDPELDASLRELTDAFERHLSLPAAAAETLALWVIFAHTLGYAEIAVRLVILSPVPACGKSVLLEILALLVPDPLPTSNISAPAIYRSLQKATPTLLIDEADTFMDGQDPLTGILNSGHRRAMAYVSRCVRVKDTFVVEKFPTFCAMAVARIGTIPPALESRSIVIHMQRAAPGEKLVRVTEQHRETLRKLKDRISKWAAGGGSAKLKDADPGMPEYLSNREADNWRHLVAIADIASDEWGCIARLAPRKLAKRPEPSKGEGALNEIKQLCEANSAQTRYPAADLCQMLNSRMTEEDEKWTPSTLARTLRAFRIFPKAMRIDGKVVRGYERSQLEDTWTRYGQNTQED